MDETDPAIAWIRAAAAGVELPIRDDEAPGFGAILARYVDPSYVAVLWVYEDQAYETGWYHDIVVFKRMPDGGIERAGTGGSDWYGAPGTPPPTALWLSGLRTGGLGSPTFVTGAVYDLGDLRLLRHFRSGEAIRVEDAPTGAFIARIE